MLRIIPILVLIGLPIWLLIERQSMTAQMAVDAAKISELQKELDQRKSKKTWFDEKLDKTSSLTNSINHPPAKAH
jgi:hypothetical protein